MPLARIITNSVDDSLELSMQLRARGFEVEMVSPDEVPETTADLEVLLEECAPEDVLNKAAQVQESEDLWVFVAPGALDERGRPVRKVPASPQMLGVPMMRSALRPESKPAPIMAAAKPDVEATPAELNAAHPPSIAHDVPTPLPYVMAGDTTAETLPALKATAVEPAIASPSSPKTVVDAPTSTVKVVVLPKPEVPQIPEVPARSIVVKLPLAPGSGVPRKRVAGPYKISFRTGPAFWKQAAVSGVLVVLAGVLAAVIGLRPSLPAPSNTVSPLVNRPVSPPASKPVPKVAQGVQPAHQPKTPASPAEPSALPAALPVATHPMDIHSEKQQPVATAPAPKAQHPPGWVSDREIIAKDTVVFYDRKSGKPAGKTGTPTTRHSETN